MVNEPLLGSAEVERWLARSEHGIAQLYEVLRGALPGVSMTSGAGPDAEGGITLTSSLGFNLALDEDFLSIRSGVCPVDRLHHLYLTGFSTPAGLAGRSAVFTTVSGIGGGDLQIWGPVILPDSDGAGAIALAFADHVATLMLDSPQIYIAELHELEARSR
jgi:hypothetical protein